MNVREMVEDYLKEHGFGGLVNTEVPCGCVLGDLAPCCDEIGDMCEAGYVHHCETCGLGTHLPGDPECECDVEGCPTAGGYCVSVNKEVTPREPDPPPEPWITDAKLQDVVEFYDTRGGVRVDELRMTGIVKFIYSDHLDLKVLVEGQKNLVEVSRGMFIRIVKSTDFMDILTMPDESEA